MKGLAYGKAFNWRREGRLYRQYSTFRRFGPYGGIIKENLI
jgi:hypothetical protein